MRHACTHTHSHSWRTGAVRAQGKDGGGGRSEGKRYSIKGYTQAALVLGRASRNGEDSDSTR